MLLLIKKLLDRQQLNAVRSLLKNASFVDGKLSAGKEAQLAKQNEELAPNSPIHQQLNQVVMTALVQNLEYQAAAMPLKVATAIYARYQSGMNYGFHVDDPVMGPMNGRYRSDISTTICLNGSHEYEGGELVIKTAFGEQTIKPNSGDAVIYPSGSLHRVNRVTKGERLAAITWAQSLVKDPAKRELLFELSKARNTLLSKQPESDATKSVSTAYSNLVRMWSEV